MRDGFGMELQHEWEADFFGFGGGFVFALRQDRGDSGDAVKLENFFGFELGEEGAAGIGGGFEQAARFFFAAADDGGIVSGERRFVKAAQIVGVIPHGLESADGGVGVIEGGDAGGGEDLDAGLDASAAHPTGEDRFAVRFGVRFEAFGDFGGVGHALRGEDDEEAVAVGILEGDVGGAGVALGVGVAEDVDGIGVAPVGWKEGVELLRGGFGERREFAADGHERVGGEDAGAAGVG